MTKITIRNKLVEHNLSTQYHSFLSQIFLPSTTYSTYHISHTPSGNTVLIILQ
jgi:hypothetical protein